MCAKMTELPYIKHEHQANIVKSLPDDRKEFMIKQFSIFKSDDWMYWNVFMSADWYCHSCKKDVIEREKLQWNDWSRLVTWCWYCARSYCD